MIRRLAFEDTLKKHTDGSWYIDVTAFKHKTSRFYGPSKTPISAKIQPFLEEWLESTQSSFEFDEFGEDEQVNRTRRRYLFCMKSDRNRCMSSSLWSDRVKNAFQRHSPNHTSTAPSLLRSAFITWMRDNTDDPEIYAQAAVAQKHSVQMQGVNSICD